MKKKFIKTFDKFGHEKCYVIHKNRICSRYCSYCLFYSFGNFLRVCSSYRAWETDESHFKFSFSKKIY